MKKEFDPTASEWQIEPTKLGNCVARILLLEIWIDEEVAEHNKRAETIKFKYESGRVGLDQFLSEIEESKARLDRLEGLHTEDRDEINSLL